MSGETTSPSGGKRVPGPSGTDWLRTITRLFREDTAPILEWLHEEYGDVVRIRIPNTGAPAYLLADPAHVLQVLETNQENYRKSAIYRNQLGEIFGQGLLTSEGERWTRQNRVITPMFTAETVRSFDQVITRRTDALLDRWADHAASGEPIDLLAEMERVTLFIIGEAMFSTDMAAHADAIGTSLRVLRKQFQRRTTELWSPPRWLPTPLNRHSKAALDRLDGIVYDLIEKRRGRTDEFDDLLSKLVRARDDETGARMDDEQIRDEIMTFLLAGHETTAAALTWTWYLLVRDPPIHDRLHERATAADLSDGFSPAAADDLQYVKQCVQEAMRIYPPVPVFAREARAADTFGDYRVPAGSDVLLSQFVLHRDPSVWSEPLAYRPARFEPGWEEGKPRYAYFPFGGGARMCIGRQFALLEAQLILARAVERFRLEIVAPDPAAVGLDSAVTMIPDRPLELRVECWD